LEQEPPESHAGKRGEGAAEYKRCVERYRVLTRLEVPNVKIRGSLGEKGVRCAKEKEEWDTRTSRARGREVDE